MAKLRDTSERDDDFQRPIQVESDNENSEQLLQVQLGERHNEDTAENSLGKKRSDYPDEAADVHVDLAIPSGQLFLGKGKNSNERFELERQESFNAISDGRYFEQESSFEANSRFIGLLSGTTVETYPRKAGIAVALYGINFQQNEKPKLIGDTVVVYEAIEQNSQFYPTVYYFKTENDIGMD